MAHGVVVRALGGLLYLFGAVAVPARADRVRGLGNTGKNLNSKFCRREGEVSVWALPQGCSPLAVRAGKFAWARARPGGGCGRPCACGRVRVRVRAAAGCGRAGEGGGGGLAT